MSRYETIEELIKDMAEKGKWYQDREGKVSTMRIVTMMASVTGCLAVLAYIAAIFIGVPVDVQLAAVGGAMSGIGEVSKAWQAKSGG